MKHFYYRLIERTNELHKKDLMILGSGLGIFGALSLANMSRWSIWFDEAFGIYLIRYNFWEVAKFTSVDVHPPLYYWALKLWQGVFGSSEIALRSLSMVMIMVAIVFVYLLVRRTFGLRVGAWVVALLAISPMLIRYATEARMYGMATAIVAAATYVLVSVTRKPTARKWVIYGILVSLGMWTHYYTAIIWIAHWVWRYSISRGKDTRATVRAFWTKDWIMAHVIAIGLFLPWMPYMITQMATVQGGGFWIRPITAITPFNFLTNIFLYRENYEVQNWLAILMLVVMGVVVYVLATTYKKLKTEQKKTQLLFMIMAFVPLVLLLLLSLPPLRPSFVDRYLLPSIPFWFASIGIAVSVFIVNKKPRVVLPVVMVLFTALSLGIAHVYTIGNYNKNANDPMPIRQTINQIWSLGNNGQPILAASPWRFYETHYYDSQKHPVYFEATDNLTWGSYEMLRNNMYRKVYDTPAFAREHGGTIWYVGDWKQGSPALPKEGTWKVIQEVIVDGVPPEQSTIRAAEIKLESI
ncbi:hypothetical protein EOL96_01880 [Candidatus Saccharibacteria bacterium]|nr:hypothetical protein [Candidatus Saccharibacteria bacterium]